MTEKNLQVADTVIYGKAPFTEHDAYLFREGQHFRLYAKLGAQPLSVDGIAGTHFAVWAPNAQGVFVIGDFNGWNRKSHPLQPRWDSSGIWEGFIRGITHGEKYKYYILSHTGYRAEKGDPFSFHWEEPPKTASVVWNLSYQWSDQEWMQKRHRHNALNAPLSIYEVHLGSWRRGDHNRYLTYRELAHALAAHVKENGFTHVELLPVMEHPFYGSWGYQTLGYFAPTARYGTPQDFMYLVDYLHRQDIGVILDWVPSHFPSDEYGLMRFDGSHLYEHEDPKQGFHPEWSSHIFNYARYEVREFLVSSALFWLDKYHADGLRVDAVASMLYLDYSRKEGEWIVNEYGGKENLGAIAFLRSLNETIYREYPDVQVMAEESTAWPMVSRPTWVGGLGFGMKWNMGWMHDTLDYFSKDPVYRKFHHNQLTFSIWYAFTENFILPFSHDEVVHGKGALLAKMPGDDWQKFANLRALYGYLFAHPGKKLLFMGSEFGQWSEWGHDHGLEWHLLDHAPHQGLLRWVRDLNGFYRDHSELYEDDFSLRSFEWLDFHDADASAISFLRKNEAGNKWVVAACNLTPVPRHHYRIGVPCAGVWKEALNSDAPIYGGSGCGNWGQVEAQAIPVHGRDHSLSVTLPPLSVVFFTHL